MNFLAHLLLAGDDPEAQVGQVLADLADTRSIPLLTNGIQAGIRAHQRIDVFTDLHPAFDAARRRLRPPYRRFAGVLLDVFFDHFLARAWDRHGDGTQLSDFAESRYEVLSMYRDLPVKRFGRMVDSMRRDNWLVGYARTSGVERALKGIAARCSRENPIASGRSELTRNYEALQVDFEALFPQVKAYAAALTAESSDNRQSSNGRTGR